jgi:hypothetical protein
MTLRKGIAAFALTVALIGFTSKADAQVTVSPGVGGVTVDSGSAGLYIPYGGGGAQFYHPSVGAWNYSNGTISPVYSSFYTPSGNAFSPWMGNYGYGNSVNTPYSTFGTAYTTDMAPYGTWGNTSGAYNSFYTPSSSWGGWTYPTTTYYYPSGYYSPTWGTTYYVSPGRGRGLFRR